MVEQASGLPKPKARKKPDTQLDLPAPPPAKTTRVLRTQLRPLNRRDRRLAGARPALLDGWHQDGQRARAARRQRERHGDLRVGRAPACDGASELTRPFASTGAIPRRSPTSEVQD